MSSNQVHDPLVFGAGYDSAGEDVPIHEDIPLTDNHEHDNAPTISTDHHDDHHDDDNPLSTTRSDAVASYGELLGATPSYEDATWNQPAAAAAPATNGTHEPTPVHDAGAIHMPSSVRDHSSEAGPSGVSRSSRPLIKVSVSDPVKKIEQSVIPGMTGGYVTYKIESTTDIPEYPHKECSVRRRFKDFVALADLLAATHRGYFIPPRPDKHPVEAQRSSSEFVEMRRQLLERYLQKLIEHPVLVQSEELRIFLTAEGQLSSNYQWQQLAPAQHSTLEGLARLPKQVFGSDRSIPAPQEAAQSTKRSGDLLRRFKELGTSIKGEYKKTVVLSGDETTLRGETTSVEEYQECLALTSRKAEKLVKKLEDYGNVLGDLGLSLVKIAKYEDEDGSKMGSYTDSSAAAKQISADARRVGMASLRLSRLNRSAVAQEASALTVLHDHLGLTPSILRALAEREEQLLTVTSLQEDLERKKQGVHVLEEDAKQVFGGDKGRTRKLQTLQNDIAALEAALVSGEAEYEKVKQRNKEELQRWRGTRAHDVAGMLGSYGRVEAAYAGRSTDVWVGVAEEFGVNVGKLEATSNVV